MHTIQIKQRAANSCHSEQKEFATLRALAAIHGHALHRSDARDGAIRYWATQCNKTQELPTIDAVRAFIAQIGGNL